MALHGGNLLTKAKPVDESPAEYLSINPESSDLRFAGPSSTAPGVHPPTANPKLLELHSNGLVCTNSQPHGYPYSTYTTLRATPQHMCGRGPAPTNVSSSDGAQVVGPTWAHIRAFRPNAARTGSSSPFGAALNQDRVFRVCDARGVVRPQQKGVTTFQTLGTREAIYMIGPKPTTVMNEAGGLEHAVVVSRASLAKPTSGSPDGVVQPGVSGTRRQWPEKHSATITTNEAEIKCPPTGSSVMSSLSLATHCPSESSSLSTTTERRLEKSSDSRRQKSSASVVCMSPVSDCEVEAAASTTTSADGGNSCMDAGSLKMMGDDSSSRELVSSSTATNDAFGNDADSSTTSTVARKSTKKSTSKPPKPGVNILGKIAALGTEPDRQQFLEDLFAFMEYRGTPITTVPVICRQTVDLYRLYHHVKERSGMVEVSKGKRWRDVGSAMGIGGSTSAGFTLKRNYGRFLFPYECKFDRGDVDPTPLLAAMETPSRKDSRRRVAEREREREIEMEESQSSSSQLTAAGQPQRNNGFVTTQGLTGYNIETTGNNGPTSAYMLSTGSAMTSGMAGYQTGFTGSAGNQSSVDPTRPPSTNDQQRAEFSTLQPVQPSNSYALHSMQCIRSSTLTNEGRGLSRGGGDFGRALAPAAVPVDSPTASKTDEDGPSSGYGSSTAGFGLVKVGRSDETSICFPNILQSTMTSACDAEMSGHANGGCELRPTAYLTSIPRVESAETRFGVAENKPSNGTSLHQMQGTSVQPGIVRLGNCSEPGALRTGQPSFGSASRGNCDGELQHSGSFCQQYQKLVSGSSGSSTSAADLASSAHQRQEPPFTASQVARKLQFTKSEVGAGSLSVMRCEMQFPPDSVEAKQPVLKKRKTLTHRDIGPVDPWGIMMSLRSGLISESTWALDVLSILLHDDFTASAFGLSHVPGLLEVVLEHLRRCLIEIFGAEHFGDLERFVPRKEVLPETKYTPETVSVKGMMLEKYQEVGKLPSDKIEPEEPDQNDSVMFESSVIDWHMGHGDTTVHIITHMASEDSGFHERQFFGKNLDVLKRKRPKSDKCVAKGLLKIEGSKLHSGNSIKLEKTMEVAQSVDTKTNCDDFIGESESNVIANSRNPEEFENEKLLGLANSEKDCANPSSLAVGLSTVCSSEDRNDKSSDEPEKERNCDASLKKGTLHQNSFEVGLSTAFRSDGIQLFSCNHLDSLKQMYGEMGEEVVQPEETLIRCWDESKVEVARRCLCLSNILRNLSLISGNEVEMSRHRGLVLVLSRLLLLHHYHRQHLSKSALSFAAGPEQHDGGINRWWWWEMLVNLRENSLVVLASIAGQMDLSLFPESICLPLLDGLLHWSICRSAEAQDPFPGSSLSVGSLVLETLCKLCVTRANVDLLIATPPFARIVLLLSHLANLFGENQPQVTRELALGLMSRLVKVDTSAARALALERSAISFLLEFIEGAEHQARLVATTQGIEILQDFPETIGTSVDMLCRAADVLLCLAQIPANSGILARFHHRLLQLVMSQILDCKVTAILAQVLGVATPT